MKLQILCLAAIVTLSSHCVVRADVINQIPGPFVTETYTGLTRAYSQYDTGFVTPPNLRNFATAYDNFTFSMSGVIDSVSWIGAYDTAGITGANFEISFYSDAGGAPGIVPLAQYLVGSAGETAVAGFPNFYSYTTTATPLAVTAGTTYWMSVVSQFDYNDAGWGLAFSAIGDNTSVQDFGDTLVDFDRYIDDVDYAVRISAVPEPSSALCLLGLVGLAGFRRRRAV